VKKRIPTRERGVMTTSREYLPTLGINLAKEPLESAPQIEREVERCVAKSFGQHMWLGVERRGGGREQKQSLGDWSGIAPQTTSGYEGFEGFQRFLTNSLAGANQRQAQTSRPPVSSDPPWAAKEPTLCHHSR